jgi:hypothetical protein
MPPRIRTHVALLTLSFAITLTMYGGALNLPLYMDDVVFGRYIESVSAGELFTRLDTVPYYRPLSNLPWKLIMLATGGYSPVAFHALNLVFHALNGYLVGLLAMKLFTSRFAPLFADRDEADTADSASKSPLRLPGDLGVRYTPYLAALFYLLFPFSYQAVGWAAALGHVMATFGALLAVNALVAISHEPSAVSHQPSANHQKPTAHRQYPIPNTLLIALGTTISIFSHENGAATALLLVGFWLLIANRQPPTANTRYPIPYILLPTLAILVLYILIWFAIPKARPNGIAVSPADWIANATYFVQGIGYPVAQAGAWVWKTFGLPREPVAAALGMGGALLALWLAGRRGVWGLLWYAIAISVPTLLLQRAYAIDGPRLMMMASPGAALLWTAAVLGIGYWVTGDRYQRSAKSQKPKAKSLYPIAFALPILLTSALFISGRMALHERLAGLYTAMFAAAQTQPETVLVNLPAWLAYRDEWFALGSEGITYMTDYIDVNDLVYVNTRQRPNLAIRSYDGLFPDTPLYWWGVQRQDAPPPDIAQAVRERGAGRVFVSIGDMWLWDELNHRGAEVTERDGIMFTNGVHLAGVSEQAQAGLVRVVLDWRTEVPQAGITAFVHGVCNGELRVQADGTPLRGLLDFAALPVQQTWRDVRWLALPNNGANCIVRVGLYEVMTGERLLTAEEEEWLEVE